QTILFQSSSETAVATSHDLSLFLGGGGVQGNSPATPSFSDDTSLSPLFLSWILFGLSLPSGHHETVASSSTSVAINRLELRLSQTLCCNPLSASDFSPTYRLVCFLWAPWTAPIDCTFVA